LKAQSRTRSATKVKYFNFTKIMRDSAFAHKFLAERTRRPKYFEVRAIDKLRKFSVRCVQDKNLFQVREAQEDEN